MAAAETESVNELQDNMTRLRMKMVQQKIANERDRLQQRPSSEESNNNDLDQQVRMQQAMLRRQELLDRIKREQLMNDQTRRARTSTPKRRYSPSPSPTPSRRSLPAQLLAARNQYMPDTYRMNQDMQPTTHVVEHRIKPPHFLPPLQNAPQQQSMAQPQQQGGVTFIPPPQPTILAAPPPPAPQIIQAPNPNPHMIVQQVPQPVVQNLVPNSNPPDRSGPMFNKADFMEMMMMQNAQMHHMVMQQMMLHQLPGGSNRGHSLAPIATDGPSHLVSVPRSSSVHHHHYQNPPTPQAQPQTVTHYTTMPQMGYGRGGYPMSGNASAYTSNGAYLYDEYPTNYFYYH